MGARLRLAPDPGERASIPPAPSSIQVVLAHSHEALRASLRILLDGEEDIEVSGEARDLASIWAQVEHRRPDVITVDVHLRGGGVQVMHRLLPYTPAIGIVLMSMEDRTELARQAFLTGALGFITTHLADDELAPAVRAAARGETYLSPPIAARLRGHPTG